MFSLHLPYIYGKCRGKLFQSHAASDIPYSENIAKSTTFLTKNTTKHTHQIAVWWQIFSSLAVSTDQKNIHQTNFPNFRAENKKHVWVATLVLHGKIINLPFEKKSFKRQKNPLHKTTPPWAVRGRGIFLVFFGWASGGAMLHQKNDGKVIRKKAG